MESLPKDPAMLVSSINMLLRDDEFDDLDTLCNYFDKDKAELLAFLKENGYDYNESQKQMRPIM